MNKHLDADLFSHGETLSRFCCLVTELVMILPRFARTGEGALTVYILSENDDAHHWLSLFCPRAISISFPKEMCIDNPIKTLSWRNKPKPIETLLKPFFPVLGCSWGCSSSVASQV